MADQAAAEAAQRVAEQAAAQQQALDAAAAEAAERAAQEAAAQQQALDEASAQYVENNEVWNAVDDALGVSEGESAANNNQDEQSEKREKPAVELSAPVAGGVVHVYAPEGALPQGTRLEVADASESQASSLLALLPESERGVAATDSTPASAQPIFFVLNYVYEDENGVHAVQPEIPVTIQFSSYKISLDSASLYSFENEAPLCIAGPVLAGGTLEGSTQATLFAFTQSKANPSSSAEEADSAKDAKNAEGAKAASSRVKADKKKLTEKKAYDALVNMNATLKAFGLPELSDEKAEELVQKALEGAENDELEYPAVSLNGSAAGIQVAVDAPAGALPEGVQLSVSAVETPAAVLADAGANAEDAISLDVHFYLPEDPATEIEPLIPISVTFANIDLDAETVDVYHETEKVAETSGEGGTLTLDEFSVYTFVGTSEGTKTISDMGVVITVDSMLLRPAENGAEAIRLPITVTPPNTFEDAHYRLSSITSGTSCYLVGNQNDPTDMMIYPVSPGIATIYFSYTHPNGGGSTNITITTQSELVYDANGGAGAPTEPVYYDGTQDVFADDGTTMSREGYAFRGWSTDPNAVGKDIDYEAGADISSVLADVSGGWRTTLYAVWDPIIEIPVKVIFDDDGNYDGLRPTNVTLELYKNGESTSIASEMIALSAGTNEYEYTFTRYGSDDGTAGPGDYSITSDDFSAIGYTLTTQGTTADNLILTYTHVPEKIGFTIKKLWRDSQNRDGKRPSSLSVQIFGTDTTTPVRTITMTGGNTEDSWLATIDGLYKYEEGSGGSLAPGTEINYTIEEDTTGAWVSDYMVLPPSGDMSSNFTLENRHSPENVVVNTAVICEDDSNRDGVRPANVVLTLYADGVKIGEANVGVSADTTDFTFETNGDGNTGNPLRKYKSGEVGVPIVYTVEQTDLPEDLGYTSTSEGDMEEGFTFTNTREPERVTIDVTKVWEDADNVDGLRPDTLYLRVFRDGEYVRQRAISTADASTSVTISENPSKPELAFYKYKNEGELCVYTVDESATASGDIVPVDEYAPTITKDSDYAFTITNTHTPKLRDITVTKTWEGEDGDSSKRPEGITVKLFANGEDTGQTLALNGLGAWTGAFSDLPVNKIDPTTGDVGVEIQYTVEEDINDTPWYRSEPITGDMESGYTLTNTLIPNKTTVTINKVWVDGENADGTRPDVAYVLLMNDGVTVREARMRAATGWTSTFSNIPVFEDPTNPDSIINYTVEEDNNAGYTVTVEKEGDAVDGYTFTVTNTKDGYEPQPETIDIPVSKVWDDADDQDGIRPDSVEIALRGNGELAGTLTLSEENNWTGTFKDMPRNEAGTSDEISYSVTEEQVESYEEPVIEGDVENGFTITNTHTPEVITIDVNKVWIDDNDRDGKRPDSVTVKLFANGEDTKRTLVLSEENNWEGSFVDLPKYDAHGTKPFMLRGSGNTTPIDYTIEVDPNPVPDYDSTVIDGDAATGFTITSTRAPEIIDSISVTKVWNDADNQDGIRPATLYMRLFKADGTYAGKQKTVSESNSWTTTFNSSQTTPIYKYEDGEEIEYTVVESTVANSDRVPAGYEMEVEGNAADGFTLTNTHKPELREIAVTKVWDDADNQDGVRPDEIYIGVYDDEGNRLRQRALSEANGWTTIITAESQYKYKPGEQGVLINYTVEESWVEGTVTTEDPDGNYELVSVEGNLDEGFIITNKHEPETIDVNVSKVWADEDDNDRDGKRPEEINFTLLADGEEVATASTTEAEDWAVTWEDMPKYNAGELVSYQVAEADIDGYYPTYEAEYVIDPDPDVKDQFNVTITNTYDPEKRTITVLKEWDDANDQDGKRPESITVNLMADGEPALDENDEPITAELSAANGWAHYFEGVWKNNNDGTGSKPITYTVEEAEVPEGYSVSYSDFADQGYITITNKHDPAIVDFFIGKEWDDDNNRDGIRPDSVTYILSAFEMQDDGEAGMQVHQLTREIVLTKTSTDYSENHWSTIIEMPKYAYGETIMYRLTEQVPAGYTADESLIILMPYLDWETMEVGEEQFFTNSHVPELVEIPVTKVWDDADDQDGLRPTQVRAFVYADGEYAGRQTILNEGNNWSATIASTNSTKLYKYENGKEIKYSVVESSSGSSVVPVSNYTSEVTGSVEEGFTITNTHEPIKANLVITKIWEDDNNRDGLRPESLKVLMISDDTDTPILKQYALNPSNGWTVVTEELPVYKNGEPIVYTVYEQQLEGYTDISHEGEADVTLDHGINWVTFLNVHEPATLDIEVAKHWADNSNQDGVRPADGAKVTLLANDIAIDQGVFAGAEDDETLSFADLPVYENGQKIVYKVVEQAVENYTTDIETRPMYVDPGEDGEEGTEDDFNKQVFQVTNTHNPEMQTITVLKTWDDADNQDGKRPDEIKIKLTGVVDDGLSTRTVYEAANYTLNDANGWAATFDVPVMDSGFHIEYSVEEQEVPEDYEVSYSNFADSGYFTITNKHIPVTVIFGLGKVWDDDNNRDGIRPASVTYEVMGMYAEIDTNNHIHLAPHTVVLKPLSNDDSENKWGTVIELPKYAKGFPIVYSVSEVVPEGYEADQEEIGMIPLFDPESDETGEAQYFTNTHVPELVEIPVTKVWDDSDNQDGVRPSEVYARVYANGEAVRQRALNEENGWSTVIKAESQYKYENGEEIKYEIVESWVKGTETREDPNGNYTSAVEGSVEDGFTITNTHEPATGSLSVIKEWVDANDQDGVRPDSLLVTLTSDADPDLDADVGLSAANGWTYTWENLPVYNQGKLIKYTVSEDLDLAWSKEYKADQYSAMNLDLLNGYDAILTNYHTPATTEIAGYKIWDDASNQDGQRPEKVTINLYANGKLVQSKDISAEDAVEGNTDRWAYSFDKLPFYDNGVPIRYNVSETPVDNYSLTIKGYDLVNTYTPGKTFTTVIKLWDDDRDRDGIRPDNGIVRLFANGEEVNRASVSLGNGWFAVWSDLPVNADGTPIEYTVVEDEIEGYTSEVTGDVKSGFTVKNTHVVETTEVTVTKVWDDDNDKDGKRPSNITVNLLAGGSVVATKVLTAEEGWKTTFTDLPKNSGGQAVVYTVAEQPVDGYVATISGTTITNKLVPCKDCSNTPTSDSSGTKAGKGANTGDSTPIVPMVFAMLSALAVLVWSRRLQKASSVVGKHAVSRGGRHAR